MSPERVSLRPERISVRKARFHRNWSTMKEKDFIDHLGRGRFSGAVHTNRLQLLMGYRKGMLDRVEWGKVDPAEVRKYVERQIRDEFRRTKH